MGGDTHDARRPPTWCCPGCHGSFQQRAAELLCQSCGHRYEVIGGIPDLRLRRDSWVDVDDDLSLARELAAAADSSLEALVRMVYARRPGWDAARVELRTRQVLEGTTRLQRDIAHWLIPALRPHDVVLDLGCGAGMLLAALGRHGWNGMGIDVSMAWLVVAKRLIEDAGGEPVLAAALGEALPLHDAALDVVVSLDVIEHVSAPDAFLSEIDRATQPGARVIIATPNRFSLTAEPHVHVWGVGWLPHRLQKTFVRWRSGRSYDDTRLMSSFGLRRIIERNTSFRIRFVAPPVPPEDIARFPRGKALLATVYNKVCRASVLRPLLLLFAPFFRVEGIKA